MRRPAPPEGGLPRERLARQAASMQASRTQAADPRAPSALTSGHVQVPMQLRGLLRLGQAVLGAAVFFSGHAVLKLGGVNLTVADVALVLAAVIFLAHRRLNLVPFGAMTPIWLLGLAAMLGGLFVSTLANGDPIRWVNIASQYAVAFFLLPLVLTAVDTRFAQRLTLVYVAGVLVSELVGIAAFLFLEPSDTTFISPGFLSGSRRVGALAGEPNPNGATIAFALAMLVYCVRKGMLKPVPAFLVAAVLIWGLLLSASVTGFTASIVAVVTVLAFTGLGRLLKVALVVVVAGGLYLNSGAPLPQTFTKRVATSFMTGDVSQAGTFTGRSELIVEAWEMAEDNIFYGLGADQYREVNADGQPVHNLHLLIWNEGGAGAYLGLLLMLSLLVVLALAGLRERREEAAMALAAVVVFLIYTMSNPHMYGRFWVLPVMLALSTIYARPSFVAVPMQPMPVPARG